MLPAGALPPSPRTEHAPTTAVGEEGARFRVSDEAGAGARGGRGLRFSAKQVLRRAALAEVLSLAPGMG